MSLALPETLFLAKRGLCPGCGTPLTIADDAVVDCSYCGQHAMLERRLRKVEPEVDGAPLRLYFDDWSANLGRATGTRWTRSDRYAAGFVETANCPGCGDALEYRDDQSAITCPSCGTDCRLERRLWSPPPDPATEIARPQHREAHRHAKDGEHPATEHLIYRILSEPDPDRRLALTSHLDQWTHVNPTAARLLPPLLAATYNTEPAFQYAAAQLICKLLCEGDKALRNSAVRACERFLFDTTCPRPIVLELGMGDGVCLKPLLDAAEFAQRHGHFEYACACLVGVNWIFQRNFPHHEIMGQIVLYRMLYLTGPVLAFALLLAQRQVTGTGFHYKPETLLTFIDEAAVERPAIMPELDKSFYCGWPKDAAEFEHRLAFYHTLKTDAARASALRHWVRVPDETKGDAHFRRFFAFVLPMCDAPGPLQKPAQECIDAVVAYTHPTPDALHELVRDRGRSLPVEVQRRYLSAHPKTPFLSYDGLPNWESKPEPALSPEMDEALSAWKDGLRRAGDVNDAIRAEASARRQAVSRLDVPIFDGKHDGPPPPAMVAAAKKERDDEAAHDRQRVDTFRQMIRHLEQVREQLRPYGPQGVAGMDAQIAELRRQCPDVDD